jgi:hypothetical protein
MTFQISAGGHVADFGGREGEFGTEYADIDI